MAVFDAHDTVRGAETSRTDGRWNVDLSNPGDSRNVFSRTTNDRMPDAFPQNVELFDSGAANYMQMYAQAMARLYVEMMMIELYLRNMYSQKPDQGKPSDTPKNSDKPDKPDTPKNTDKPDKSDTPKNTDKPDKPDTPKNTDKPDKPDTSKNTDKPDKPDTSKNTDKPDKPDTSKNTDKPDTSDSPSSTKLTNIPYERGKTIYHDDFSGARGAHPNSKIFDTAHISADGLTRQRGPSIHEDALINSNNTVMDGNGHLQLFAQKDTQIDPVNGETVHYTKGSFNTGHGLRLNLKDHPNGVVIEVRAKHPNDPGAKFDALWIMTDDWAADPKKGQKPKDTIEYDAAEGGGADITVHYPYKGADGQSHDKYGGGAHPKDVKFDDGQFHTYTVVIKPNEKTGRGDVVEYVDGKQRFAQESVFPGDKDLHLRSSLEVSPKWTGKTLKINGGMDSDAAGEIDYLDVSELK